MNVFLNYHSMMKSLGRKQTVLVIRILGKEYVADNLMRVCSKEIVDELLELTFG